MRAPLFRMHYGVASYARHSKRRAISARQTSVAVLFLHTSPFAETSADAGPKTSSPHSLQHHCCGGVFIGREDSRARAVAQVLSAAQLLRAGTGGRRRCLPTARSEHPTHARVKLGTENVNDTETRAAATNSGCARYSEPAATSGADVRRHGAPPRSLSPRRRHRSVKSGGPSRARQLRFQEPLGLGLKIRVI